jgi:hypothetical protein
MLILTEPEWRREYASAFARVFVNPDPFDAPFTNAMEARALLYPVAYTLERNEYDAVAQAARVVGDSAMCLSIPDIDDHSNHPEYPAHWLLEFRDFAQYEKLPRVGILENALYSPTGEWGLLISHEQHMVVGGSAEFVETMVRGFPGAERALEEFLDTWAEHKQKRDVDTAWIHTLFVHLYGQEVGSDLYSSRFPEGT